MSVARSAGAGRHRQPIQPGAAGLSPHRATERTIDKHGPTLLLPAYVLQGWTTTLPEKFSAAEVIALHCDHATHEQFDSEFKTDMDMDMDMERLPAANLTQTIWCASWRRWR